MEDTAVTMALHLLRELPGILSRRKKNVNDGGLSGQGHQSTCCSTVRG